MNGRFALMMLMGLGASVPEPVQVYDTEPLPTRDGRYRQRTPHGVFYGDTVDDVEREIRDAAEIRRKEEENRRVQAFLAAERKSIEWEADRPRREAENARLAEEQRKRGEFEASRISRPSTIPAAATSTRDPAGQDRIQAAIMKRERKAARLRGEK